MDSRGETKAPGVIFISVYGVTGLPSHTGLPEAGVEFNRRVAG